MGMYALIEDARSKALSAANCWHETPEAIAVLAKIDAFERCSDRWFCESNRVAEAFTEAAKDAENELDQMRYDAVNAAADTYSADRHSDEWLGAWDAADSEVPTVDQVIKQGRRNGAGDDYLQRFAA